MVFDTNGVLSICNEPNKTVILKFLPTLVNIIIAIIYGRVNTVYVPSRMAQIDGLPLSHPKNIPLTNRIGEGILYSCS